MFFDEGITINVNNKEITIYFVLFGLLGDNLGINSLFGYSESFTADYWCRFCRVSKYLAYKLPKELHQFMRDSNNYANDLESKSCGVKSECIFNNLKHFCHIKNNTVDPMQDLHLGVCRYDMALIINYCIKKKYFTLSELNQRLKQFNFKNIDRGNKLCSIKQTQLDNSQIVVTSGHMSFLVTYFSIIVGHLIPPDDPVWDFYSTLYDLVTLAFSSALTEDEIGLLEFLIETHNTNYQILFNTNLKPKQYIITHYPMIIREMGPLKLMSCEKFEANHKIAKDHAKMVKSRISILLTLSNKMKFNLAQRFYSSRGFHNTISFEPVTSKKSKTLKNLQMTADCEVSFCNLNGVTYKCGYAIRLQNDSNDEPRFAIITNIIKTKKNRCFLVIKNCTTLGLRDHYKAFQILLPDDKKQERLVLLTVNKFVKPISVHKNCLNYNLISLRDMEE